VDDNDLDLRPIKMRADKTPKFQIDKEPICFEDSENSVVVVGLQ